MSNLSFYQNENTSKKEKDNKLQDKNGMDY